MFDEGCSCSWKGWAFIWFGMMLMASAAGAVRVTQLQHRISHLNGEVADHAR